MDRLARMRATVSFPDLDVTTPVQACCYCAPDELGGFIDISAHDALMINLRSGDVTLFLRREENSYFWEVIGVEPLTKRPWLEAVPADSRV